MSTESSISENPDLFNRLGKTRKRLEHTKARDFKPIKQKINRTQSELKIRTRRKNKTGLKPETNPKQVGDKTK